MKRGLIQDAVKKLSDLNVFQPSSLSAASPVVVIIQKGKSRFCVDLREFNSKTSDRYVLLRQDSIFRSIGHATWDCNKGYHQFGLTLRARLLTVFVTKHIFWKYIRMSLDLKNASTHFQRDHECDSQKISMEFRSRVHRRHRGIFTDL